MERDNVTWFMSITRHLVNSEPELLEVVGDTSIDQNESGEVLDEGGDRLTDAVQATERSVGSHGSGINWSERAQIGHLKSIDAQKER